ncbi:hypothetical protein REPUB_Repub16aG0094800 [Reevesia pubescens]
MASRLLEFPKQNEEWEDVGIRYLNDLWSRCFIQEVKDHGCYFTFKMHDLIHDLALDVSQKECKAVYCQTESIDEKIRHLSFCDDQLVNSVPQFLKKLKNVRTIVRKGRFFDETNFINFCISNFKYLRTLDLSNSALVVLPDSIGTLKHLRYLDLYECHRLFELPSSFYKLQSLLMLNIKYVRLKQLPNNMQSLIRLRHLEITLGHGRLWIQPGGWSSLQYLCLYQCWSSYLFEGIQYLTSLRTLYVCRSGIDSLPRNVTLLTKLEHLQIDGCHSINLHMEPAEEEVPQDLHLNLKTFSISESEVLEELPRLLLEGSASTLQHIRLDRLPLKVLPEWLQNLTSLQKLEISKCNCLSSLPEGMNRLTALTQLKIRGCKSLSERCRRDGGEDWPKIAHVQDVETD